VGFDHIDWRYCVIVGGGNGGAELFPKFHEHDAVACEPAGCIGPTLPVTFEEFEPLIVVWVAGIWIAGKAHSNASSEMVAGVCGFPSMVSCWLPLTAPRPRN